eukprot:1904431-Amphidinium_carterae.1
MRAHIKASAHPSNAARPGSSIRSALRQFVVSLEISDSKGETTAGFHTDLAKAYEVVILDLLKYILLRRGWPRVVVNLMVEAYKQERYISYRGWAGAAGVVLNGICAGCPLAVWALGEYMRTLATYVSSCMHFRQYVDDCAMWSASKQAREAADAILGIADSFREWLDHHGLDINEQKSILWATHGLARAMLTDTPYGQEDC